MAERSIRGEAGVGALKFAPPRADGMRMRHASVRGFGIRYFFALTLPVTGMALVLYTVVQLFIAQSNGIQPAQRPAMVRAAIETPHEASPASSPSLLRD